MKLSAILAPLIAAKVPHEVILQTVLAFEAEHGGAVEASKEKARARWRKWKDNQTANVGKRLQTTANNSRVVEDKPLTTEIEPQEERKKETRAKRDVDEFKAELSSDLDAERIDALVKHRRHKRGQITGHAARLFRRDAEDCQLSLAEAADACISRNWITVKPEFFASRQARGSPPAAVAPSQSQIFDFIGRKAADEQGPEDRGGVRPALSHLSVVGAG